MNVSDKIKYTNKYPHFSKLLMFYNFLGNSKKLSFLDLKDFIGKYKEITMFASGPSLNLCKPNSETLYLTTNSSYLYLEGKYDFVHVIKDLGYLRKFLLFGLKYNPKLVIIEIPTHSGGNGFGAMTINYIKKYLQRRKFPFPIVITNNENLVELNKVNYYSERLDFVSKNIETPNPDSNSGLMLYGYGIWLTSKFDNLQNFNIYGLDAGEGGKQYFDGSKTLPRHVAMRDENKNKMKKFIEACQQELSYINNFSYFINNTNK
ncbi:hypothetical protein [Aureivirga sp. CE67]|uniref:hypothetical protein n=1 Tax=Aureivirga sp. CE67 TaxID=1788983 RepID=UPI0018CA53A6|nr:hypothetical protein [Aureivirga sp. CE67]